MASLADNTHNLGLGAEEENKIQFYWPRISKWRDENGLVIRLTFLSFFFSYFFSFLCLRMQAVNNSHVQSTLLTLHDAITDSPVYRSSSLHFDEQLDLLEKWLDSLSKYMKQYAEKLNSKINAYLNSSNQKKKKNLEFNLETNTLCKKVIPVGIDSIMIDPNFTGAVIKNFSDALQTSLAFKTKLVMQMI